MTLPPSKLRTVRVILREQPRHDDQVRTLEGVRFRRMSRRAQCVSARKYSELLGFVVVGAVCGAFRRSKPVVYQACQLLFVLIAALTALLCSGLQPCSESASRAREAGG